MKNKRYRKWLFVLAAALLIVYALNDRKKIHSTPQARDYAEIQKEGVIRAVMEYNSIGMFADGDTLSGFYYELIQAFAKAHGLKADITPEMSFAQWLKMLSNGSCDLVASGIPINSHLKDSLLFTKPIVLSKEVLVQRKPGKEDDSTFINNQLELAQCTLHVVKGSPAILRIRNLSDEIADTIYIKEIEHYGMEQLIALVAHGDIGYAVCDEHIAQAAADSMPQIDLSTDIGFTQFYAWGVSKQSPVLLDTLNAWLDRFKQSDEYHQLYRKYYHHK